MLYVIYGTDIQKARKKAQGLSDVLQKKRPDASVSRLNQDNWSENGLDELISSVGLFVAKNIITLDGLLTGKDSSDYISSRLPDFKASEHVFILLEGKLTKEYLKKLEKNAEKIEEHSIKEGDSVGSAKKAPETFAFADALASRNKKRAWSIFQSLARDSVAAEEIHGVLWWQFKSIVLALQYPTAKDAGLNPYVYQKAKGFATSWTRQELSSFLDELIRAYHVAHKGELDLMLKIESFCLR